MWNTTRAAPHRFQTVTLTGSGLGDGAWREEWDKDAVVVDVVAFEAHLDGKADVDRVWFAADDVRRDAKVGLLGQLDDRNHVRNGNGRIERLIVDREGEHRPVTGHRLRDKRAATGGAVRGRWMNPQPATRAARDQKLPVAAGGPKCPIVLIEFWEHPRRDRGYGVIWHNKESTFQLALVTKIDRMERTVAR
jgi:hypothetical protein